MMLGRSKGNDEKHFQQMHLHKNKLDQPDKEWRCIKTDNDMDQSGDPDTWYSYYKFPPSELKAVYFGVNIDADKRQQLAKLIKDKFPLTKMYQTKCASGKYALEFVSWRHE
jgi:hypothetical protein